MTSSLEKTGKAPSGPTLAKFNYELCRAVSEPDKYPPFNQLRSWQAEVMIERLGSEWRGPMMFSHDPAKELPPGWSRAWSFNLHASDEALTKAFLKEIHSEQASQKIPRQEGKGAKPGNYNKGVAWEWIELLLLNQHQNHRPFTKRDKDCVARAMKRAKELRPAFDAAWRETEMRRQRNLESGIGVAYWQLPKVKK